MIYTDEFIPTLEFWPEKDVLSAFQETDQAIGTDREALALKVFYTRMKYHLKTSDKVDGNPDMKFRMIEHYERPRLEAEIARMTGTVPAPCEGCPFTPGCKQGAAK